MFNNFIFSYAETLWEFLRPTALVESIHACLRVVSDSLSGSEAVNNSAYNPNGTASIGYTVSIPLSNIVVASCVAGVDVCNPTDVAGVPERSKYRYYVYGLPEDVLMLGKSPDSDMATVIESFIPHGPGYLFKESPSKYGTVSNQGGTVVISFYVVGGPVVNKHQPQFKLLYDRTSNRLVYEAVKHETTRALVCAGVSNAVIKASEGVSVASGDGVIKDVWQEGNMAYAVSGRDLLQCPAVSTSNLEEGRQVTAGDTLESKTAENIIIFPADSLWYVADRTFPYDCSALPETVKELYNVSDRDSFDLFFSKLKATMKSSGIATLDLSNYSLTTADYRLLATYIPEAGSIHLVKRIFTDLSSLALESSESSNEGETEELADTLYVFYTNTSGIPDPAYSSVSSPISMLHALPAGSGCWRVTGCINTGDMIYGVSSNSTIFGVRPSPESKIYGISLVKGRNNYKQDVVYRYSSIPPVTVGSGVEVVVVGVL